MIEEKWIKSQKWSFQKLFGKMLESDGISDDISDWGSDFDDVEDEKVGIWFFMNFRFVNSSL